MKNIKSYIIYMGEKAYECTSMSVIDLGITLKNGSYIVDLKDGPGQIVPPENVKAIRLCVKDIPAPIYIISEEGARLVKKRFKNLEHEEACECIKILKGGRRAKGKPISEDRKFVENCAEDFLDAWGVGYEWFCLEEGKLVEVDEDDWFNHRERKRAFSCAAMDKDRVVKTKHFDYILKQVEHYEELERQARERAEQEQQAKKEAEKKQRQLRKAVEKERKIKIFKETSNEIKAKFEQQGLLSKTALSGRDKYEEFERVRKLCIEYLPELGQREFKPEKLLEQYSNCIDAAQLKVFVENWNRLCESWARLKRGIKGEEKVAEVLSLYDDRLCYLQNYTWGYEHDFIVFAPGGIFTIEVKTLRGNYILTETGILKDLSHPDKKGTDVVLQSKKHIESLRRNLKGCSLFNEEVPLQEIICSGEADFKIKNEFPAMAVCYYNTLDSIILSRSTGNPILSRREMEGLRDFLLQNQEPEHTYEIFAPRGELDSREQFIRSFIAVAAGLRSADTSNNNKL